MWLREKDLIGSILEYTLPIRLIFSFNITKLYNNTRKILYNGSIEFEQLGL
jgi:hypothetical protein